MAFRNTVPGNFPGEVTYKKCSGEIVTVEVFHGTNGTRCACVDLSYTIDYDPGIEVQECKTGSPGGDCNDPTTFLSLNRCCCEETCGASGAVPSGAVVIPSNECN
jgi:hypothetical protein